MNAVRGGFSHRLLCESQMRYKSNLVAVYFGLGSTVPQASYNDLLLAPYFPNSCTGTRI